MELCQSGGSLREEKKKLSGAFVNHNFQMRIYTLKTSKQIKQKKRKKDKRKRLTTRTS